MGQPNQQPGQPWQQFTVLDGLLLQAGYAIAFSVVFLPARGAFEAIDIGSVVLVLIAACLGGAVSGPIVLGSQWLFRGRWIALSAGEWLWLSPLAVFVAGLLGIWVIYWGAHSLPDPEEIRAVSFAILAMVLCLVEIGCAVNALIVLLARTSGELSPPPCSWTDRFGALTCLVIGAALFLIVAGTLA
ncbi:MAG: hypothetical protein QM844_03250 [Planctomycetota bacterium]|nr:hypothetical protein [Planctomycetota bacterium]